MAREDQNLVLGRGRVYVDRYDEAGNLTGEVYIGNTPSLSMTGDEETLEHVSSDEGLREVDEEIALSQSDQISFTTDDIQPFNLAMFFRGVDETFAQAAVAAVAENVVVQRGRWYQLGTDDNNPTGKRALTLTSVTDNAGPPVAIPNAAANYTFDGDLGRIFIKADAPDIEDGDTVIVTFDVEASSRSVIISRADQVMAAVRFISANPHGAQRDHYWPKVRLAPDGDYELKGDDWQEIGFQGTVLTKTGLQRHYADGRAVVAP